MKVQPLGPVLLLACSLTGAQTFTSGPRQAALVELYTSEGCSSCPPADRRMNGMADDPELWKSFVPAAFHVDYWNHLGWKDRFSAPAFSARQRQYAKTWKAGSVYTPCFVVNGKIDAGPWKRPPGHPVGTLGVAISGNTATISFSPIPPSNDPLLAWLAPLGGPVSSRVEAGENRGRTLDHHFVVLDLASEMMEAQDGTCFATLPFPENPEATAVAVWISSARSLVPIQAAGGWLE